MLSVAINAQCSGLEQFAATITKSNVAHAYALSRVIGATFSRNNLCSWTRSLV
jgi:hypothetical protein